MPGYVLVELANMQPHKARGIVPRTNSIGILDFLRELDEEPFPLPKLSKWQVVGLEEALFAARPNERDVAIEIHGRLNRAAGELERRLIDVQVVFVGQIIRGADLRVKYRGEELPIGFIFNHPQPQTDAHGNPYYPMEFHLSSP
jgi:hypothetical protein